MTDEERIKLRDELLIEFQRLGVIIQTTNGALRICSRKRFVNAFTDENLSEKYDSYASQFRTESEAIYCITHITDPSKHLCYTCNNICYFHIDKSGSKYTKTCGSNECHKRSITDDTAVQKCKQTNLARYGVEYPMQSKEVQKKVKNTNLEKYGAENPFASEIIKNKIRNKIKEKYDVENVSQAPSIKEKRAQTNFKRFGVKCSFQAEECKEKSKETCKKRYGSEYASQSKEIQDKMKQTNLERYGVENAAQSRTIRKKMKETMIDRYGVSYSGQTHITNFDIWKDDEKFTQFVQDLYKSRNAFLTLSDVSIFFNVSLGSSKQKIESLNLLDFFHIQESNLEVMFKEFLIENNVKYDSHNRSILSGNKPNSHKEIDFYCESNNIGFEINDIASHNSLGIGYYNAKDKYYHKSKLVSAQQCNVKLIHIWEWEMRNDNEWNRLSKWILNLLNNKNKIGARKCIIKEVSIKEEKKFLNEYHLQGYKKSSICLGLYYDDELIELMSFCKPRYNKNYQYELLRLCTKYDYTCIGGAQKLLKYFIEDHNLQSIISYCDLSKFTGKVYEDMGFKLDHITEPQIIWCNKDMRHFNQTSLNMIGADKMIGTNYGKGTDNVEIVVKHGYVPVYNCGLAVYTYAI